jgi:hypothetical protein
MVVLIYILISSVLRVPFSPHPQQHMLLFVFLMVVILIGVRWNLNVVMICISFMPRDDEHFFMWLLAIWPSSFEKGSVQFICPFLH